jgi:hypothetical protein
MSAEDNRIARAKFRSYLLREWPERAEHRAAVHFALVMLENEDAATGEIRVSEKGLARQYDCATRNAWKWMAEVKRLGLFEVCGKWWPEAQLRRKAAKLPATACNVYRRRHPDDIDMTISSVIPSKDNPPSIPRKDNTDDNVSVSNPPDSHGGSNQSGALVPGPPDKDDCAADDIVSRPAFEVEPGHSLPHGKDSPNVNCPECGIGHRH